MTNKERVEKLAKELYNWSGRYGSHGGTLWKDASGSKQQEYIVEAKFILHEFIELHFGYARQPEPHEMSHEVEMRQSIESNIEGYTLSCQKCAKGYFSKEAFPGVQICLDCYEPPQDKVEAVAEILYNLCDREDRGVDWNDEMDICIKPCSTCLELECPWRGYSIEWRQRENKADRDEAEGRFKTFDNVEDLIKDLHSPNKGE